MNEKHLKENKQPFQIFKAKNYIHKTLSYKEVKSSFEEKIYVKYNSMEHSEFKIKINGMIFALQMLRKQSDQEEHFERVLEFTNFIMKFGYSSSHLETHDVIILRAHNLKITLYFNPPFVNSPNPNWKNIMDKSQELLNKHCIKTNLLKRYRMVEPIGKGGFATVYKMERKSDKQIFAVKLIKKSSLKSRKEIRYLKNEVKVLRDLYHQNIVKTYEIHEIDIYIAIVQEHLSGDTLRHYYKNNKLNEYNAV